MCLRSSSVPEFSTLISTNWPQLRSTAWRHIFSRSYGNSQYGASGLRMWTARHIDGSLQRLCHGEHTICALVRISNTPSLIRIAAVTSRGRASQLRNSSGGGSMARFSVQGVSDMGNGVPTILI
jgi:hypothetical protein